MTAHKKHTRPDYKYIKTLIDDQSAVLDLGCGSGELLSELMSEKNVRAQGIEIDEQYIFKAVANGVSVIHSDADEAMDEYPDKSFDYVVLSQTLQVVKRPDITLKKMLRVGETGIVSMLNFGLLKVRLQLLFQGIMPVTKSLPYNWYNTPNIHLCTIKDFVDFCRKDNIVIKKQINLSKGKSGNILANLFPNLFADISIFVIEEK